MKRSILLGFFLVMSILVCCGHQSPKTNSQVTQNSSPTAQTQKNYEPMIKEFLTTLYNDYVLGINGFKDFSRIKSHFSDKVLTRLRNEFVYDGEGYAVWLFRSGAQEGPSFTSQVNSITAGKNGWYTVSYTDAGYDGKCRFLVSIRNGEVFIEDFE